MDIESILSRSGGGDIEDMHVDIEGDLEVPNFDDAFLSEDTDEEGRIRKEFKVTDHRLPTDPNHLDININDCLTESMMLPGGANLVTTVITATTTTTTGSISTSDTTDSEEEVIDLYDSEAEMQRLRDSRNFLLDKIKLLNDEKQRDLISGHQSQDETASKDDVIDIGEQGIIDDVEEEEEEEEEDEEVEEEVINKIVDREFVLVNDDDEDDEDEQEEIIDNRETVIDEDGNIVFPEEDEEDEIDDEEEEDEEEEDETIDNVDEIIDEDGNIIIKEEEDEEEDEDEEEEEEALEELIDEHGNIINEEEEISSDDMDEEDDDSDNDEEEAAEPSSNESSNEEDYETIQVETHYEPFTDCRVIPDDLTSESSSIFSDALEDFPDPNDMPVDSDDSMKLVSNLDGTDDYRKDTTTSKDHKSDDSTEDTSDKHDSIPESKSDDKISDVIDENSSDDVPLSHVINLSTAKPEISDATKTLMEYSTPTDLSTKSPKHSLVEQLQPFINMSAIDLSTPKLLVPQRRQSLSSITTPTTTATTTTTTHTVAAPFPKYSSPKFTANPALTTINMSCLNDDYDDDDDDEDDLPLRRPSTTTTTADTPTATTTTTADTPTPTTTTAVTTLSTTPLPTPHPQQSFVSEPRIMALSGIASFDASLVIPALPAVKPITNWMINSQTIHRTAAAERSLVTCEGGGPTLSGNIIPLDSNHPYINNPPDGFTVVKSQGHLIGKPSLNYRPPTYLIQNQSTCSTTPSTTTIASFSNLDDRLPGNSLVPTVLLQQTPGYLKSRLPTKPPPMIPFFDGKVLTRVEPKDLLSKIIADRNLKTKEALNGPSKAPSQLLSTPQSPQSQRDIIRDPKELISRLIAGRMAQKIVSKPILDSVKPSFKLKPNPTQPKTAIPESNKELKTLLSSGTVLSHLSYIRGMATYDNLAAAASASSQFTPLPLLPPPPQPLRPLPPPPLLQPPLLQQPLLRQLPPQQLFTLPLLLAPLPLLLAPPPQLAPPSLLLQSPQMAPLPLLLAPPPQLAPPSLLLQSPQLASPSLLLQSPQLAPPLLLLQSPQLASPSLLPPLHHLPPLPLSMSFTETILSNRTKKTSTDLSPASSNTMTASDSSSVNPPTPTPSVILANPTPLIMPTPSLPKTTVALQSGKTMADSAMNVEEVELGQMEEEQEEIRDDRYGQVSEVGPPVNESPSKSVKEKAASPKKLKLLVQLSIIFTNFANNYVNYVKGIR